MPWGSASKGNAVKRDREEEPLLAAEAAVFEALRRWRLQAAAAHPLEGGKPRAAFMVFSDAVLRDICRARPATQNALLSVSGVGAQKLAQFGGTLIPALTYIVYTIWLSNQVR